MNRQTWTPVRPDGSIDEAELRRPADTAEPTTWELAEIGKEGAAAAVFGMMANCSTPGDVAAMEAIGQPYTRWHPAHRFEVLASPSVADFMAWVDSGEPNGKPDWRQNHATAMCVCCTIDVLGHFNWLHELLHGAALARWPLPNVTLATAPIRTQAEADRILLAFLGLKAARREAVFAPREAIDLPRTGALGCSCENEERCSGTCAFYRHALDKTKRLDAVRVRGGDTPMHPDWVRELRDQARDAGVPFSLAWGTWAPLREVPHSPTLIHMEMFCPFGPEVGVFTKQGPGWQCRTLDGVDYPEEP